MDCMNSNGTDSHGTNSNGTSDSPYKLLLQAVSIMPIHHYLAWILLFCFIFLYRFLELHILRDLVTGFKGQPVSLAYHSRSELYRKVVSKCRILHGRYLSTPWLSSPHLQTAFLSLYARAPTIRYTRHLLRTSDGGTIALDWLKYSDVSEIAYQLNDAFPKDEKTPIVIVIPGLTSDSTSSYVKHFAFTMAKNGWNVVVSNHRGLGGISITSDCFYNAGWTEDAREVIGFIHKQYQEAPLFVIGTSVGANVLVKYLGEEGSNTPVFGAAAICSPWDALICDRFLNRRTMQKWYGKALAGGLKSYAKLHQSIFSRLTDWECVEKSCSLREFDTHATRVLGKYETVDTYYRRCSSSNFVGGILVPLLCINALDDPVCTKEAIAWDECRLNENIVLATTEHGGHLAYFEGLTAKSLWWVRAVHEFLSILNSSSLVHNKKNKIQPSHLIKPNDSSIDHSPYLGIGEDGTVLGLADDQPIKEVKEGSSKNTVLQNNNEREEISLENEENEVEKMQPPSPPPYQENVVVRTRRNSISFWLLVYIAVATTWPLVGSALKVRLRKKFGSILPAILKRK